MTRAKPPAEITGRRKEGKKHSAQSGTLARFRSTIFTSWKIIGTLVALFATSIGVASGYLSVLPKLTVEQNLALDPNDPFSAPFVVSNDGPLGINDAKFICLVKSIDTEKHSAVSGIPIGNPYSDVPGMEVGERTTVPCAFSAVFELMPGNSLTRADIVIGADFRPDYVFWRIHRDFRFKTLRNSDRKLYWYPYAYDRTPDNRN